LKLLATLTKMLSRFLLMKLFSVARVGFLIVFALVCVVCVTRVRIVSDIESHFAIQKNPTLSLLSKIIETLF
jgi:hypothetical protein